MFATMLLLRRAFFLVLGTLLFKDHEGAVCQSKAVALARECPTISRLSGGADEKKLQPRQQLYN